MKFGGESDDANSGNNTVMGLADFWATDYRRGDVSDRLLRDRGYPRVLQMTKGKGVRPSAGWSSSGLGRAGSAGPV